MKLLGAALILCGAALQCHALLGARRQERAALRELSAALEGLERGIRASLMPLPRLLGQRGAGKYADAFFADVLAQLENGTPLPDGWREAVSLSRYCLSEQEKYFTQEISMDIDLVFKIAAIGIVVAVLNQLLVRSDRPDQAMLVSLAGLVTTMMLLVREISSLFELVKTLFGF